MEQGVFDDEGGSPLGVLGKAEASHDGWLINGLPKVRGSNPRASTVTVASYDASRELAVLLVRVFWVRRMCKRNGPRLRT